MAVANPDDYADERTIVNDIQACKDGKRMCCNTSVVTLPQSPESLTCGRPI